MGGWGWREERGGEEVEIFCALDGLLIYWGLSEIIHPWRRGVGGGGINFVRLRLK